MPHICSPAVAFRQPQAFLGVSPNCYGREKKKIIICLPSKHSNSWGLEGGESAQYPCERWPQKCNKYAMKGMVWHNQVQHFRGQWWADSAVALGQQGAS